jgi:hypothetical protein
MLRTVSTAACALVLLTTASQAADQVLKGDAAFGDWRDDKPGVKRVLTAQDLPPVSSPTYAAAAIAPMPAGARPLVPAGFSAEIVASGLANPRATSFSRRTASGCSCPSGPGRTSQWTCSRNRTSPGLRLRSPLPASNPGSTGTSRPPLQMVFYEGDNFPAEYKGSAFVVSQ